MPHSSASVPVRAKAAPKAPSKKAPSLASATLQSGMGAVPHDRGTTFRVWAPHAEEVAVIGTFNNWAPKKNPLQPEGNGYWATDVAGAKPGDEYKFHLCREGQEFDRNDPYARQVTHSAGSSVIFDSSFDWGDDHFQMPSWNELVIYELHVGTFNAADASSVGTFLNVVEKLPYLRDLGINCIELLPATEFPGDRSWGYNPAHPFALESDYGGPIAFKELVKQAHQHGIAVVLDVVYNHFGPGDLDLWQFDGWSENDGGGIYFYNDWRAETPWGHNRPDYGRPEVRQYIRDNALMWLNEYRCDGLRADAIAFIRNVHGEDDPAADLPDGWSLMRWINEEIDQTMPWKITIAEDLRGNASITETVGNGGQGFDSQWDGSFVYPIREALTIQEDADRDMQAVATALGQLYNDNAFRRVIYTESHDEVANGKSRVPEEIMPGDAAHWFPKKRATLGAALVLTAPGIPMLFQGQEFLADGAFSDAEPLQWERVEEHGGLVHLYRDLIGLRRNLGGKTRGLGGQHTNVFHVNNEAKLVAFARQAGEGGPGDTTVVLANFANQGYDGYTIGLPGPGHWQVRFNSDWKGYDGDFSDFDSFGVDAEEGEQDGLGWHGSFGLAPYSVLILSQEG
ncbi:alpha-amylase family glycosyl hydrolase [Hymenobacter sp. BT770]|uniref:alpha-amylase family glycosyl hydrolase n=1 Tax=Hymenobacter sp. BT770 TaxID=2886942 RepID=UPI001D12AF36|nr:alpha-amylase family glycosyl hydrolase [Hymenobacter sp. BT770]MCC3154671.1 alpha amylase C-terminal domain-containing protein [Hymenobacter sp. BT770]MDO3416725.1 alpha-amylase family glycosyl hydrolase [Hymenobacter sp. BT770]